MNEHHHIEVETPETFVTAAGTFDCTVTLDYMDEKETAEDSNVYGPPTDAWGTPSPVPLLTQTE